MLAFISFYIREQLKLKDTAALLVRCHYIKSRYPFGLTLAPPLREEEKLILHPQVSNLTHLRRPSFCTIKVLACITVCVCVCVECPSGGTERPVAGVRQRKDKIR